MITKELYISKKAIKDLFEKLIGISGPKSYKHLENVPLIFYNINNT